jgi:very-short-patch-repair endonuclease
VGDEEVSPADAARHVEEQGHRLGFLPGPLPPGAALPLSDGELRELYSSNDEVSADHEQVLADALPERDEVLSAEDLRADVELITTSKRGDSGRYWRRAPELEDSTALDGVGRAVDQLLAAITALAPWQRKLVAAGRTGGGDEQIWRQLGAQVKQAAQTWQQAQPLLLEHDPTLDASLPRPALAEQLAQIRAHVEQGGNTSGLSMLFRSGWRSALGGCRVRGQTPTTAAHFAALSAAVEVEQARAVLAERWARQAEPAGLPPFKSLPDPPEPTLGDYVQQFERLLGLWAQRWGQLHSQVAALGFVWDTFRADEIARATPSSPFESDLIILGGPLKAALGERLEAVGRLDALRRLKGLSERLGRFTPGVCRALQSAVADLDVDAYERERRRLEDLWKKADILTRRRELLRKLSSAAPEWGAAVERRRGVHGALVPPRDLPAAWRWRQLEQELSRRGARDDRDLGRRLEGRQRQLRELTVDLVDRRAWLAQLRRTGLEARQALIGWADTQRKIGKGTGKRAPALQLKARELLTRAREAVPVWIMPLARVAESFDPRHGKFDVVIVDEASQCDLAGLLALYLGKGAVIVGDHEQVSPSAIGEAVADINSLISQFLGGVPNNHLYDGQTSVYDLARQSFGGTIGLREHFRCVPEIIDFSNQLSYHGEIRPLRDPNTARKPHVVEYSIPEGLAPGRRGKVNDVEAHTVAALVAAAMQLPEYEGKTFGAISLLGDEQAAMIQSLVQRLVPLPELERRRFVAGNPAQFQGDERDIVFLSMVDVPGEQGQPLPIQERLTFKQRYNVAASRAKDQLWLVHSLDPARDLQPGDLRRRLIEHVRDPAASRQAPVGSGRRAVQSPFEEEVLERLRVQGFRVDAQVEVGGFPIDLVVSDGRQQVAIECDGDRTKTPVRIAADMARQAVLERVGWRFIRVRSTRFFATATVPWTRCSPSWGGWACSTARRRSAPNSTRTCSHASTGKGKAMTRRAPSPRSAIPTVRTCATRWCAGPGS